MAYTLKSIDEAIYARAHKEACNESQLAVNAIPYWDNDLTFEREVGGKRFTIKIDRYNLLIKLQAEIQKNMTKNKVEEYTRKILETVDELEFLRESVENLESRT